MDLLIHWHKWPLLSQELGKAEPSGCRDITSVSVSISGRDWNCYRKWPKWHNVFFLKFLFFFQIY
jgi:hypothetical protein